MNYTNEDYENAIMAELQSLHVDEGGYLRTLEAYAGQMNEETALEQFVRGFPGVLIIISDSTYREENNLFWSQDVGVKCFIGARSWRSQDEARGDDTGISRILMDIRSRLMGHRIGLEIRPVEIVREEFIMGDPSTVLWGAEYLIINDNVCMQNQEV
jgi:hypothetical protein